MILRVSGAEPADPAQYPQLNNVVEALAIGDGIPEPAVYVISDPSPNAFSTGVSPDKAAITFTTGLLAIMNREELEGVASHEISHIKNYDIRLLLIEGTMIGMAAMLASILWRTALYPGGGRGRGRGGAAQVMLVVLAAAALLAIVGLIFGPLARLALSRRRESLADVGGVELKLVGKIGTKALIGVIVLVVVGLLIRAGCRSGAAPGTRDWPGRTRPRLKPQAYACNASGP